MKVRIQLTLLGFALLAATSSQAANGTWLGTSGAWSAPGTWTLGNVADGTDSTAFFTGVNITANQTVNLDDVGRTIGNITFTDETTSSHNLTISGTNILTLDRTDATTPTIDVTQSGRVLTITSQIAGSDGLRKDGAGILVLRGTNTYTGGTTVNGGGLNINSDSNLGAAGTALTFDASATVIHGGNNDSTINLGARPIVLNNNAIATFDFGRGKKMTTTGAVTGTGGVAILPSGGNAQELNLLSTANTFTGSVEIRSGSDRPNVTVNSLADSASTIALNDSGGRFRYGSGAVAPLTLNNRTITIGNVSAFLDNLSSFPITINSSVSATGAGSATLNLSGGNGGTINADINQGSATLGLSTSGPWTLAGTNTVSGTTTINGGTLRILGTQAMPSGQIQMFRNTTLQIRTDDAGTVNLGNNLVARRNDTSTGIIQNYTIDVANNGGATTGSTIVFGNMDFTVGDMRPPRQFTTEGADGYRVQVGDVILTPQIRGTSAGGAQRIRGNSAPIEITGTVKQINGNTGVNANANTLYLGGTGVENLISGFIADADDFTDNSNPNAAPLNVFKGEAGQWTLTGNNTYTGNTTISVGTLEIGGSGRLGNGSYAGNISIANTSGGNLRVNSTSDQTYSGVISGAGALNKDNTGVLTLTNAANSYSGATTITGGTLAVTGAGSINSSSGVTLNGAGATLLYSSSTDLGAPLTFTNGTVAGTNWNGNLSGLVIEAGRTISPGNSPGTANTINQTWAGGGTYLWEINDALGTAGSDPGWDLLQGTGTLTITADSSSPFNIDITSLDLMNSAGDADNFSDLLDFSWLIADFLDPVIGFDASDFLLDTSGFSNPFSGTFGIALGGTGMVQGDNSQIYLTYTGFVIPEPSRAILFALGLVTLLGRRRR